MSQLNYQDYTVRQYLKEDSSLYLLLVAGIILKPIHPIITVICFFFILFFGKTYSGTVKRFDIYSVVIILTFALFVYNGVTTGNVTTNNAIWYSIPSILAFFIGRKLYSPYLNDDKLYLFLFMLSATLAIPHIPITIEDVLRNGLINPERTISILGDEVQRAVTGRTVELSLAISGIAALFITSTSNIVLRTNKYFWIIAIIAEICTLHYVSRTGIVLFAISLFLGFWLNKRSSKQTFVVLAALLIVLILFNNSGIFSVFADREIENSSFGDAGGRTERWAMGWMLLFQNTNGYSIEGWYAHNFWLDFGREGGLYSFLLLSLFSVAIFIKTIRIYISSVVSKPLRMLILLFSLIFIAALFSEPVHSGSTVYMYAYFLFSGIVIQMSKGL